MRLERLAKIILTCRARVSLPSGRGYHTRTISDLDIYVFDCRRVLRDRFDNWYDITLYLIDVRSKIYLRKVELIVSNSNKNAVRELNHCGKPL